jgi:6-phospho-beta-glucosidase
VPGHARGLIEIVKDVERTTIAAADSGSSELALRAIALHPLVPSTQTAAEIWAAYREQQPLLAERYR